jgi:hypothetical protein
MSKEGMAQWEANWNFLSRVRDSGKDNWVALLEVGGKTRVVANEPGTDAGKQQAIRCFCVAAGDPYAVPRERGDRQ